MSDGSQTSSKKGLIADVRPGSVDITGQQRELYPFDAFEYSSSLTGEENVLYLKSGWELDVTRGTVDGIDLLTEANYLNVDLIEAEAIDASKIDVNALFAENITVTGSIESENYVPNSAGWRIDATGIEIDDGTFRGDIEGANISGSSFSLADVSADKSVVIKEGEIRFGDGGLLEKASVRWDSGDTDLVLSAPTIVLGAFATRVGGPLSPTSNAFTPYLGSTSAGWRRLFLDSDSGLNPVEVFGYSYDSSNLESTVFNDIAGLIPDSGDDDYIGILGWLRNNVRKQNISIALRALPDRIDLRDLNNSTVFSVNNSSVPLSDSNILELKLMFIG